MNREEIKIYLDSMVESSPIMEIWDGVHMDIEYVLFRYYGNEPELIFLDYDKFLNVIEESLADFSRLWFGIRLGDEAQSNLGSYDASDAPMFRQAAKPTVGMARGMAIPTDAEEARTWYQDKVVKMQLREFLEE